jgi:hypothetical protein
VLEWPVDKFHLMLRAVARRRMRERAEYLEDLIGSIQLALGGKGDAADKHITKLRKEGGLHEQ